MRSVWAERSGRGPGARLSPAQRRARDRRRLAIGLAVSALLHLLLVGLAGDWLAPGADTEPPSPGPIVVEPPRGMRAVDIREVPASEQLAAVPEPEPTPARPEAAPSTEVAVPDVVEPSDAERADERSPAERLAPRVVDPRLWRPLVLIPREPTLSDVEARIGAAIELLSDSALAEAERAVRARDWTVRDADGERWGISPGKLHLGKLTLPLPIYFAEEWDPNQGEWLDLETQVDRARVLDSFESRVKAIRERRDRERAERRKAENGG